jgi:hypothetical protein
VISVSKIDGEIKHLDENRQNKINSLKNSILMETTPNGNVMMYYDASRESFIYYSNSTIPYKYLETVARKYVINNRCKYLYVSMEKEIENARKKLQEELEKLNKPTEEQPNIIKENKTVFAKFKNYNVASGGVKSASVPRKNSTVKPGLLKENANRFTYEGKLNNFPFLKKVDKKVVDKKAGLSYIQYKMGFGKLFS